MDKGVVVAATKLVGGSHEMCRFQFRLLKSVSLLSVVKQEARRPSRTDPMGPLLDAAVLGSTQPGVPATNRFTGLRSCARISSSC